MLSLPAKRSPSVPGAADKLIAHQAHLLKGSEFNRSRQTNDSSMGRLPLERMKNVLYGANAGRTQDAGYYGTPKTCTEYIHAFSLDRDTDSGEW